MLDQPLWKILMFSPVKVKGQFRRSWKRFSWKKILLTLLAVTRIINLVRCISQFKRSKFLIYGFYFRPALFFKKQVIFWDVICICSKTNKDEQGEREREGGTKLGNLERTCFWISTYQLTNNITNNTISKICEYIERTQLQLYELKGTHI